MSDEVKPWSPGRRPGAINRKTKHFQEVLEARGFDIAEALLDIRDEAAKDYVSSSGFDPQERSNALRLLFDVTKEIASYALPKLKSIEVRRENTMEGMSAAEKLQVMREAVAVLEAEVGNEEAVQIESKE